MTRAEGIATRCDHCDQLRECRVIVDGRETTVGGRDPVTGREYVIPRAARR